MKVPQDTNRAYFNEALSDLSSARNELDGGSPKWAISKAYQALFLMTNAILVSKMGHYSKDHSCVLVALMHHRLIPDEILKKIHSMLEERRRVFSGVKQDLFAEVSNLRITRNKYLYLPATLRKISAPEKEIVEEVRLLIMMLGEAL